MVEKIEESAAQLAKATLTDEALTQWQDRIGSELRVGRKSYELRK